MSIPTKTPKADRLYHLATYGVPYDTSYSHNYQVWQAFKILKGHLQADEIARNELRAKIEGLKNSNWSGSWNGAIDEVLKLLPQ